MLWAEALVSLLLARMLVYLVPFRWTARLLGRAGQSECTSLAQGDEQRAQAVALALRQVADRLPGRWSCLVRAVAGHLMLRRRAIPCSLWLGANLGERGFHAHAWLRSGGHYVTGRRGVDDVRPLQCFSWPAERKS